MLTIGPTCIASVTATTVAEAPGARRPRSHLYGWQVPWDVFSEIRFVRADRGSSTLTPLTSAAATVDRFVTTIVHVIRLPTRAAVGRADFTTSRSRTGDPGGVGGFGVALRVFVKVQTTTSPEATAPSAFVPVTDNAADPFRVQSTRES
jgi:hypothetical protein